VLEVYQEVSITKRGNTVNGKVIFTSDVQYEILRIRDLSSGFIRKFYVFIDQKFENLNPFKTELSDFVFVPFSQTRSSPFISMFTDNSPEDFFALKNIRFSDLMNRDIEMYQTILKGYKLIIDNHPFMGKADVFWSYFPWSFFDKSLLGYPHSYAFRDARAPKGVDPYDCSMLAEKVAPATETTIKEVFSNIITERVALAIPAHEDYQQLKKSLFDTKTSPYEIIKGLKNFVDSRDARLKKGFKLLYPNKIFNQYCEGERVLVVSNSKVDFYLESLFWKYIRNTNVFMETLWKILHP